MSYGDCVLREKNRVGHLVTSLPTALHLETSHTSYTMIPCSVSSYRAYTNPVLADVTCVFWELRATCDTTYLCIRCLQLVYVVFSFRSGVISLAYSSTRSLQLLQSIRDSFLCPSSPQETKKQTQSNGIRIFYN